MKKMDVHIRGVIRRPSSFRHCERSVAIPIAFTEIASAGSASLAMTGGNVSLRGPTCRGVAIPDNSSISEAKVHIGVKFAII